MPDPSDRAIYGEAEAAPSRRSRLGGIVAVLAMLGFGVGLWYVYDRSVRRGELLPPPVVTADPAPVKSAPTDAGGMVVPNQQAGILNQSRKPAEPKVESLLPPPERPKAEPAPKAETPPPAPPPPQAAAPAPAPPSSPAPGMPAVPAPAVEVAKTPVAEPPKQEAPSPAPVPAVSAPSPTPPVPPKAAVQPAEQVAVAPPAPPASATPSASAGGVRIQLASLPDAQTADQEWKRLQRTNADLLGSLSSRVVPVQLEGKGTWFRLQAGPFADKSAAQKTCEALKQRKLGCFLAP